MKKYISIFFLFSLLYFLKFLLVKESNYNLQYINDADKMEAKSISAYQYKME